VLWHSRWLIQCLSGPTHPSIMIRYPRLPFASLSADFEVTSLYDGGGQFERVWLNGAEKVMTARREHGAEEPHSSTAPESVFSGEPRESRSFSWTPALGQCGGGRALGRLEEPAFAAPGYTPEQVILVLITHLHSDH